MRKKITYLILFLLLVIFTFIGFKIGLKPEVFGDASQIIIDETIKETGAINSVTATAFPYNGNLTIV